MQVFLGTDGNRKHRNFLRPKQVYAFVEIMNIFTFQGCICHTSDVRVSGQTSQLLLSDEKVSSYSHKTWYYAYLTSDPAKCFLHVSVASEGKIPDPKKYGPEYNGDLMHYTTDT